MKHYKHLASASKTRRAHPEHDAQVLIFQWAAMSKPSSPLRLLFAVPNAGRRSLRQGAWLKAEGMRAGVPDIWLPVARGKYHGAVVELKVGKGKPTPEQRQWIEALRGEGWDARVCYGADEAIQFLLQYLLNKEIL